MNMYKWVDEMIAAEQKRPLPVLSFPAVQKLGINVMDLVKSSDMQAKAMKVIVDSFPDMAASLAFMDLSVEAEAFGSKIHYSDNEVPTVYGHMVETEEDAEALEVPELGAGRTNLCIDAVKKAKQMITDRPVIAGCIGPFSLAGRLLDVTEALIYCYEEPDMVEMVLEKTTEFIIKYIRAYKEAGADGVLMAEPLAGILSPDLEEEFSAEYVKRIVDATQDENFIVAYHNCGNNVVRQMKSLSSNGCRMYHFGNAINMADVMPLAPANALVLGNVDPAGLFRNGTPAGVSKKTKEIMDACSQYPNFIISSGCDIPPMTSWMNINAFFEAVRDFNNGTDTIKKIKVG